MYKIDILKPLSVHIVGIGGSGTFYLAKFLHFLGWKVTGSDLYESDNVLKLKRIGIKVFPGHSASNICSPQYARPSLVIYSTAVPEDVPEIEYARKEKIPLLQYNFALDSIFSQLKSEIIRREKRVSKALEESNFNPLYKLDFSKVKIIGVTGTKGKTTVAMMIYHVLNEVGIKAGVITTVMAKIGRECIETGLHTTSPPSQELAPILEKMIHEKAEVLILEITSHGLSMHRVEGIPLDVAVYTNISEDHLDFHKSWKEYAEAKARMIDMIRTGGKVVLNRDDRSFLFLEEKATTAGVSVISYGQRYGTLVASNISSDTKFVYADIDDTDTKIRYKLKIEVMGEYNIKNALAAILALREVGVTVAEAINALSSFKGVEGRMEIIQATPFYVIVDFAHTPDSLENALKTVSSLVGKNGRLFAVFGCAGLRDSLKRPKMGKIASELADVIVLTAEDPRAEILAEINDQIIKGMVKRDVAFYREGKVSSNVIDRDLEKGKKVVVRFDKDNPSSRKDAINWAICNARSGDVVILLGKGHEKSLCFGTVEYPWSDTKMAVRALKECKQPTSRRWDSNP